MQKTLVLCPWSSIFTQALAYEKATILDDLGVHKYLKNSLSLFWDNRSSVAMLRSWLTRYISRAISKLGVSALNSWTEKRPIPNNR
jgi:hypothetical protein